ncbi:MAG: glycoside hydrolase family 25 protein [Nonlabens sp.]|uniref:glycoside hydrolase family 25 protein n=1 Tax=Nonlabens sp. TaxID=1888209 RepID=UPI003EF1DEA0
MRAKKWLASIILMTVIAGVLYVNRYPIYRWYIYQTRYESSLAYKSKRIQQYDIHGIDISHHQGKINWSAIKHPDSTKQIDFVFIRAAVGTDTDKRFKENWKGAANADIKKGAYHYYWSDVNSAKQAAVFTSQVTLKKGDLPPVLDIEDTSNVQNKASLRKGLKNWIKIIEAHYGVKPIIYSGEAFYRDVLKPDAFFKEYPRLWIANYNRVAEPRVSWHFWQYSDRFPVSGINTLVDGNVYGGNEEEFEELLVP